jgi:DNA-binding YbaB/EbfC family protein
MNMPPNMAKMLEQAQKLQEEMAAQQDKLKDEKIETSSGGGMVKVVVTGAGRVESLHIDPDAFDPDDAEMLSDMVMAAINEALRQADELRDKAMGDAAGFDPMEALGALGLGGPGGGLPGGLGAGMGGGGAPGGVKRAARRAAKKKR